jgi:hypothetical protein
LIQLLVRATKIGWFDGDAQQGIVKDVVTFLSQPSSTVYLLGLKILNALVMEMNTPSGSYSLIVQRKTAVSFRDTALLSIFNIGLTSLRQLREGTLPGSDERLLEAAVNLVLKSLSFDFVGTSLDESAEDLGTIQVPSSWRPPLEEPRTMALLLVALSTCEPRQRFHRKFTQKSGLISSESSSPRAMASRRSARNCSTISPAVRLRSKPVFVVAQKSHPIAQPTCDERQPAARSGRKSGISTDSTVRPSARRSSSLVVPSLATWRTANSAAGSANRPKCSARPAGMRKAAEPGGVRPA